MNKLIFILVLLSSCKSFQMQHDAVGIYYAKGYDFEYELTINNDNTFLLKQISMDAAPECSGRWQYLSKDLLSLDCEKLVDLPNSLTNSYMNVRHREVTIINQNKLKMGNVILKRQKKIPT